MWFSYLSLDASADELDYDLAISTHDGVDPSETAAGIGVGALHDLTDRALSWPVILGIAVLAAGAGAFLITGWVGRRRRAGSAT